MSLLQRVCARGRLLGLSCALLLALLVSTLRADGQPLLWLPADGPAPVLAYPARLVGTVPAVVFLHGMCDTPENECRWLHRAATDVGHLVCPRAAGTCQNGGSIWSGPSADRRAIVENGLAALKSRFGDANVETGGVLIGFSQGAYEAVRLVHEGPGPFSYLLLIGAKVELDARLLEKRGIVAVLLASGEYDGARPAMQKAARDLARAGIRAEYRSLGRVGHSFAPDMETWTEDALRWLVAGEAY
jgi:predicted esterase